MKKTLKEELERIHTLTYGKTTGPTLVEGLFSEESKDSKKADTVPPDVQEFFDTLENAITGGGLSQQSGSYEFVKGVESMQIGLTLLGYELPRFGVDGLFGPETSNAVKKFNEDNKIQPDSSNVKDGKESPQSLSKATPEMLRKLVDLLKSKDIQSSDIKKYTNMGINTDGLVDKNFYEKLLENLEAPITDENLKFLYAWRQAEGKAGDFNPFNTTQPMPGATKFNKVGVRNYTSLEQGMVATIKTLKNGRYDCIIDGLRGDIGADNIAMCSSLKTWGTGSLVGKVIAGYNRGSSPKIGSLA